MTSDGPIRLPRNPAMPATESERAVTEAMERLSDAVLDPLVARIKAIAPGFDANGLPTSEFDK